MTSYPCGKKHTDANPCAPPGLVGGAGKSKIPTVVRSMLGSKDEKNFDCLCCKPIPLPGADPGPDQGPHLRAGIIMGKIDAPKEHKKSWSGRLQGTWLTPPHGAMSKANTAQTRCNGVG